MATTTVTATVTEAPSTLSLTAPTAYTPYKHSHTLLTAPCTKCGHAEPIRTLLSVVEHAVDPCPTCTRPPSPTGVVDADSITDNLNRTFEDLAATLEQHGAELARLSLCGEPNVFDKRSSYGHLLVHDVEDLQQFTAGVTRLLQTLHANVRRVEDEARTLRSERAEVKRLREELQGLREAEENAVRARVMMRSTIEFSENHTPALSRAMSFATIDYDTTAIWTEEQEKELKELEKRLVKANRSWSDEQEDVLPIIEQLKEERRKAKKLARHSSIKIDADNLPADGVRRSFSLRQKDSKLSLKSRRSSAGDAVAEKKSKLMRFFSGKKGEVTGI